MKKEQWNAINAGEVVEVDDEDFWYFLECLPPPFMSRWVKLMNGDTVHADFGFVEGADRIIAFYRQAGKCYAAGTTLFSK